MDTLKYKRLKLIIKNNIRDGIWKAGEKGLVRTIAV